LQFVKQLRFDSIKVRECRFRMICADVRTVILEQLYLYIQNKNTKLKLVNGTKTAGTYNLESWRCCFNKVADGNI
jgi:hypothetical protein